MKLGHGRAVPFGIIRKLGQRGGWECCSRHLCSTIVDIEALFEQLELGISTGQGRVSNRCNHPSSLHWTETQASISRFS